VTNLELAIEALELDRWMTPYEMQQWAISKYGPGALMSESGLTARLRQAKSLGHEYECRKRAGAKSYEYKRILPKGTQLDLLAHAPWTNVPKEILMSDEDFRGL
jgi:hypothetical protein